MHGLAGADGPNSSKIANGLGAGKFNQFAGFIAFKFWSKFPHPVSSFVRKRPTKSNKKCPMVFANNVQMYNKTLPKVTY